jgi:tRNA 2-thiouridine synthesizing protein A
LAAPEATLDITADTCPITFVRAKLALEKMHPGDMLRIRLREGEPLVNVPFSLTDHGHEIVARKAVENGIFELLVRRGADLAAEPVDLDMPSEAFIVYALIFRPSGR